MGKAIPSEVPGLGSRASGFGRPSAEPCGQSGRLAGWGAGSRAPALSRRDLKPGNLREGERLRAEGKRPGGDSREGHAAVARGGDPAPGAEAAAGPARLPRPGGCGLGFVVYRGASVSPTVKWAFEESFKEEMS